MHSAPTLIEPAQPLMVLPPVNSCLVDLSTSYLRRLLTKLASIAFCVECRDPSPSPGSSKETPRITVELIFTQPLTDMEQMLCIRQLRRVLATNCIYVLRQVAAANVVADLWADLKSCDVTHKPTIQTLAKVRNLCALVVANGDIPAALKPFAIHGTSLYAEALLRVAFATRVKDPSKEIAGDAFRTLVVVWHALDGPRHDGWDAARKRLKAQVVQAVCASYVALAIAYRCIPGTDGNGDADDGHKVAAFIRDAWAVATAEQRALPELLALNGVYSHLGAGAPMTMAS